MSLMYIYFIEIILLKEINQVTTAVDGINTNVYILQRTF